MIKNQSWRMQGNSFLQIIVKESLIRARKSSPAVVFALRLASKKHNFIYSPVLIKKLLAQDKSSISEEPFRLRLMTNAFGLSAKEASLYQAIIPQLDAAILPHLRLSDVSKETLKETITHLEGNLPDLVTFNPSMVDQEPWVCKPGTDIGLNSQRLLGTFGLSSTNGG